MADPDPAQAAPVRDVAESVRLRQLADSPAPREERLRRGFEASAAVVTAGLEAASSDEALEVIVREVRDRLPWGAMAVARRDAGMLRVVAEHGAPWARGLEMPEGDGILGHVVATGRPYLAEDVSRDPHYVPAWEEAVSEMCAPLVVSGRVIGVLNAESSDVPFTAEDLEVLTRLAEQVSLVLHKTELLTAEQATVARLHELDRMKTRLLTIASHELRTPLTVVLGFAELLAEHADTLTVEDTREYTTAIRRQAGALARTVDQMLLAAQLEQGQLQVQVTPCALLEVVARALTPDRREHVEVLPGTDTRVLADPFRLQQVLGNLFDNAITYARDAGRIQLDARTRDGRVTILIRDEGPGIPAVERDAVFEAFHQVGEHGIAGRRGLGLGLSLARDLLRLMDGELSLVSAEGYGATLTLDLPAP